MKTLSQVLEFQASNRTRLATLASERVGSLSRAFRFYHFDTVEASFFKEKKAVKFAHLARDEIKRRIDLEKCVRIRFFMQVQIEN